MGGGRAQQVMTYFQLDQGLIYLRVYFLDLLVCDGLSYHTRRQLTGCSWYLSTTASTTSTRESADSQSRVSTYEGPASSSSSSSSSSRSNQKDIFSRRQFQYLSGGRVLR